LGELEQRLDTLDALKRESDFALPPRVRSVAGQMLENSEGCIETVEKEIALIWQSMDNWKCLKELFSNSRPVLQGSQ
jgi:hypothetical protein